jgi:hypothetical protein
MKKIKFVRFYSERDPLTHYMCWDKRFFKRNGFKNNFLIYLVCYLLPKKNSNRWKRSIKMHVRNITFSAGQIWRLGGAATEAGPAIEAGAAADSVAEAGAVEESDVANCKLYLIIFANYTCRFCHICRWHFTIIYY